MSHDKGGFFPLPEGDWIVAQTERGIVPTLEGYMFVEKILRAFVPKEGTVRTLGAHAIDTGGSTCVVATVTWGYDNDHDRTLQLDPAIWRELNDPSVALVFEAMAGVLTAMPERSEVPQTASIITFPATQQVAERAA